jgi:hypothetical protein
MTGLLINGPNLLKWNSTHDVNSVTALETLSSTYPQPLFQRQSYCTSQGHSSCLTETTVITLSQRFKRRMSENIDRQALMLYHINRKLQIISSLLENQSSMGNIWGSDYGFQMLRLTSSPEVGMCSVSIVTTLRAGRPGNRSSNPARTREFLFSYRIQTGCGAHSAYTMTISGALSSGDKWSNSVKLTTHLHLLK